MIASMRLGLFIVWEWTDGAPQVAIAMDTDLVPKLCLLLPTWIMYLDIRLNN